MHATVEHRFEDILRDMVASLIDVREELARVRAEVTEVREESRRFDRNLLASFRHESRSGIKSVGSIDDLLTTNLPANNTIEMDHDDQSFVKVDKCDLDDSSNAINSCSPSDHQSVEEEENESPNELKMHENKKLDCARLLTETARDKELNSNCSDGELQRSSIHQTPVGGDRCQADRTQQKRLSMAPFCLVAVAIVCLIAVLIARWIPPTKLPGAERKFDGGHRHKQHRGHGEGLPDMEPVRNRHRPRDDLASGMFISPAKQIIFAGNQRESTRLNVMNRNRHRYAAWWFSVAANETTENGSKEKDNERYDYWRVINLGVEGRGSGSKSDPHCQCGVLAPRDRLMLEIVKRGLPLKLSGTLHDTLRIEWMELDALYDDAERRFDEVTIRRDGCTTWRLRLQRDQRRAAGNGHQKRMTTHTSTVELIYKL